MKPKLNSSIPAFPVFLACSAITIAASVVEVRRPASGLPPRRRSASRQTDRRTLAAGQDHFCNPAWQRQNAAATIELLTWSTQNKLRKVQRRPRFLNFRQICLVAYVSRFESRTFMTRESQDSAPLSRVTAAAASSSKAPSHHAEHPRMGYQLSAISRQGRLEPHRRA